MNWLSIIIILLIIGILLDGVRRVRKTRREGLRLSRRAEELDGDDVRVSESEFPSGGARVAVRRDQYEAETLNQDVRKSREQTKPREQTKATSGTGFPPQAPEQASLDFESLVPMLMDSVVGSSEQTDLNATDQHDSADDFISDKDEPPLGDMEELDYADDSEILTAAPRKKEKPAVNRKLDGKASNNVSNKASSKAGNKELPAEVLVISVMAKAGEQFSGENLLNALVNSAMKFGEMDIFHYHEEASGDGAILFSLANMLVPGTFNLAEMTNFSSPGVSLFLRLPTHGESLHALDMMTATAKSLAASLEGELKDENRSVMTQQTFEHYRQRVLEFERQRKLQNA